MKTKLRLFALLALLYPTVGWGAETVCSDHLFVIERSKNKNLVVYDANRGPSGEWDSAEPVTTYWLLNGDKDKREELTAIERDRAYGVEVTPAATPGTYTMVFKAQRKRQFTVQMHNGCPVVTTQIQGHNAIVHKLYVKAKETLVLPKVDYIEFFGEDADTGKPLDRKLKPAK